MKKADTTNGLFDVFPCVLRRNNFQYITLTMWVLKPLVYMLANLETWVETWLMDVVLKVICRIYISSQISWEEMEVSRREMVMPWSLLWEVLLWNGFCNIDINVKMYRHKMFILIIFCLLSASIGKISGSL